MDTSLEWASCVMELNMEEDCQVPSSKVNAKNNDRFSSSAVPRSIQKERPKLSSSLHCVLKSPPLYLEEHKLRAVKAHLSPSFACLSIMVGLPFSLAFTLFLWCATFPTFGHTVSIPSTVYHAVRRNYLGSGLRNLNTCGYNFR